MNGIYVFCIYESVIFCVTHSPSFMQIIFPKRMDVYIFIISISQSLRIVNSYNNVPVISVCKVNIICSIHVVDETVCYYDIFHLLWYGK